MATPLGYQQELITEGMNLAGEFLALQEKLTRYLEIAAASNVAGFSTAELRAITPATAAAVFEHLTGAEIDALLAGITAVKDAIVLQRPKFVAVLRR